MKTEIISIIHSLKKYLDHNPLKEGESCRAPAAINKKLCLELICNLTTLYNTLDSVSTEEIKNHIMTLLRDNLSQIHPGTKFALTLFKCYYIMGETHPTFNSSYSSYRLYQSDRHTTSLDAADQIIKVGIRPKKL